LRRLEELHDEPWLTATAVQRLQTTSNYASGSTLGAKTASPTAS
jgi:hypothetical protein